MLTLLTPGMNNNDWKASTFDFNITVAYHVFYLYICYWVDFMPSLELHTINIMSY
jgi:hypothetical protein